jgi:hypothetical protein
MLAQALAVEAQAGEGREDVVIAEHPDVEREHDGEQSRLRDEDRPREDRQQGRPQDEAGVEFPVQDPARAGVAGHGGHTRHRGLLFPRSPPAMLAVFSATIVRPSRKLYELAELQRCLPMRQAGHRPWVTLRACAGTREPGGQRIASVSPGGPSANVSMSLGGYGNGRVTCRYAVRATALARREVRSEA